MAGDNPAVDTLNELDADAAHLLRYGYVVKDNVIDKETVNAAKLEIEVAGFVCTGIGDG